MDKQCQITKRQKGDLERELEYLKTTRRREVEVMISEAMGYGDLENNLEFDAAKKEQQKLHSRIEEIEKILSFAVVMEIEEQQLSEEFLTELRIMIQSCGLAENQVASYLEYRREKYEVEKQMEYGILPSESCLETLKEAQRITALRPESYKLNEYTIDRFLQIPCGQWKSAKNAIKECFGCNQDAVNALYDENEECLRISADSIYALANYLKITLHDKDLSWKIFQRGFIFGVERIQARIASVLELLGEEFGIKVIRADAEAGKWLFWGYFSDPVELIAYMMDCGLTSEKILTVVQKEPDILYLYKKGRKLSYLHDQEYIDNIIYNYLK